MQDNSEILPPQKPENQGSDGRSAADTGRPSSYHLHLHNPHLHANDIDAYRRLASECGIDFAEKVLASNERKDKREFRSFIVGMITAGGVLAVIIWSITATIIKLGWFPTLGVALLLLACSHVLRVLLTGEWSSTSWFGRFISDPPKRQNDDSRSEEPPED